MKRCESYEAAELDAKEHMMVCDKHPLRDLLESCKSAERWINTDNTDRRFGVDVRAELVAAISKAESTQ